MLVDSESNPSFTQAEAALRIPGALFPKRLLQIWRGQLTDSAEKLSQSQMSSSGQRRRVGDLVGRCGCDLRRGASAANHAMRSRRCSYSCLGGQASRSVRGLCPGCSGFEGTRKHRRSLPKFVGEASSASHRAPTNSLSFSLLLSQCPLRLG